MKATLVSILVAAALLLPASGETSRGKFRPKLKRMEQALVRSHHVLKHLGRDSKLPVARAVQKDGSTVEVVASLSGLKLRFQQAGSRHRDQALTIGQDSTLDKVSRSDLRKYFRGNEAVLGKNQIAKAVEHLPKAEKKQARAEPLFGAVTKGKRPGFLSKKLITTFEADLKAVKSAFESATDGFPPDYLGNGGHDLRAKEPPRQQVVSTPRANREAFKAALRRLRSLTETMRQATGPQDGTGKGRFVPPPVYHVMTISKGKGLLELDYAFLNVHWSQMEQSSSR